MKKLIFTLLFFLSLSVFAEDLHYYSNGKKIVLSEASGYSFVLSATKSVKNLPAGISYIAKQDDIFLFEEISSSNLKELKKNGALFPAYKPKNGAKLFLSGRIFVKIPGRPNVENAKKWCRSNGLTFIKQYERIPQWYLVSFDGNSVKKSAELVEKKAAEAAEPSFFFPVEKRFYVTNDDHFFDQWHLHNFGDSALSGSDHAHVAEAWEVLQNFNNELGGTGVKLAIIDDGFDLTHEDLRERFVPGHDFADGDDLPYPGSSDMHGTSVAGVAAAATDNSLGVAGACPNCSLIPIRMGMSSLTLDSSAIEAFQWAANAEAQIISNSWGPADGTGQTVVMNQPLQDLLAELTTSGRNGLGIIILFAAGNGGESIETDGFASNGNVFAIGATNAAGVRAVYSDFGNSLDFMAPSNDEDPSGSGDGWSGTYKDGIWTTDNMGGSGYNVGDASSGDAAGNYTNSFGGTSSACPLAAGITGLVLSANPNLTKEEVYEIYKRTSDKTGGETYNDDGFSANYGYGRINACEAVKEAFKMAGKDVSGVLCGEEEEPTAPEFPDEGQTSDGGNDLDVAEIDDADVAEIDDEENFNDEDDDFSKISSKEKGGGCSLTLF